MNDEAPAYFLGGMFFALAIIGGIHALTSDERPADKSCWMFEEC